MLPAGQSMLCNSSLSVRHAVTGDPSPSLSLRNPIRVNFIVWLGDQIPFLAPDYLGRTEHRLLLLRGRIRMSVSGCGSCLTVCICYLTRSPSPASSRVIFSAFVIFCYSEASGMRTTGYFACLPSDAPFTSVIDAPLSHSLFHHG